MGDLGSRISSFFGQKSIKYGLPFLLVILGGSFGLKEFSQIRYQFASVTPVNPANLEKKGIPMKKTGEVTIETEYEKMKKMDIDNWEQVRGPRPWEEKS